MSVYRAPAPRCSEALARLGEMLAKEMGARVTVNDERISIRGPRGEPALIGCTLAMAAFAGLVFVMLGLMVPIWARVGRWIAAGLSALFVVTAVWMVARGRTTIDLRSGTIRSRKVGLTETASLADIRGVTIERAFSGDRGGDAVITLQTTEGPLEIIEASDLRASTGALVKAFATALAAWLGIDLTERSTLATRIALRAADERLQLDVTGIPTAKNGDDDDDNPIIDAAATAVEAAATVIRLLDAL